MHKNDSEIRTLFGKLYVWHENDGRLTLLSVEYLERLMEKANEMLANLGEAIPDA